MKLLIHRVYFKLPSHPDLIVYPFFRDYQKQFISRSGFHPEGYLYQVANDHRTRIYVFPSLLINYRHILKPKTVVNGVVTRPLLYKITIYPVVKGYIELAERFFSKRNIPVVYAFVRDWSPYTMDEFIDLIKKYKRPYAYMYAFTLEEVEKIMSFGFEMVILDAYKLNQMGADTANDIILRMLKIINK